MAETLSDILSDNNTEIRQKVAKDSITPETTANRLDAIARFANAVNPFFLKANSLGIIDSGDPVNANRESLNGVVVVKIEGPGVAYLAGDGGQFTKVAEDSTITMNEGQELVPNQEYLITPGLLPQ